MDQGVAESDNGGGAGASQRDSDFGSQDRLSSFKKQNGKLRDKIGTSKSETGLSDQYQRVGLSKLMSERKRETARLLAKQQRAKDNSWYKKPPTIAGEANSQGSTFDRLCSPASFTGVYKREDRGGYVDPVRRETTDMLKNRSSKKGELTAKANAQNFRNEVEWRMSLQQRTEAGDNFGGGGDRIRYVGQMKSQYRFPTVKHDAHGKKTTARARKDVSLPSLG
jgi:hypothetical protein